MAKSKGTEKETEESSIQFMLAEFSRIQEIESYNRSTGETRVNLYITLVSLISGFLVALRELTDPQDILALRSFFFIGFLASGFMSLIGIVSFQLLIERWKLSIIYLRKLARIRRWFVKQDTPLQNDLVYSANERSPSFVSKSFLSSSLITLVSLLNSVAVSAAIIFFIGILHPYMRWGLVTIVGIISAIVAWVLQRRLALTKLSKFEKDEHIAFPPIETTEEDQ
jgi:hypothetical protein